MVNEICKTDDCPEEAYELGVRDGYEKAVQDLDVMLGGDGEYYVSTCGDDCADSVSMKAKILERWNTRTAPKVKPLESQTGLYEGDRILIEGNWGIQNICQVERFRDCLGVFMSDAHRKAGRFIPLSEMYGHGAGSKTGYIGNFGEYIENPVALWMQVPKDTPLTNEW